jgi:hypothetical protein
MRIILGVALVFLTPALIVDFNPSEDFIALKSVVYANYVLASGSGSPSAEVSQIFHRQLKPAS